MSKLKRIQLFGKLNPVAYRTLESATVLCKTRGNPYVEAVHWINQILMSERTDFHAILAWSGADPGRIAKDLTAALDLLPRGASSILDFSTGIELSVKEAWMAASLIFGERAIRTGHLLLAMRTSPELKSILASISPEFLKVNGDLLQEQFAEAVKNSDESGAPAPAGETAASGQAGKMMSEPAMGRGEALERYTVDMTAKARKGDIDPIVGRDAEIRRITDILMRRRQNNPIITGEAGVGKTAVVEGFAQRLAAGDVPDCLKGTALRSLDIGLLQAGASMKGEFEDRLKHVIEDVKNADVPTILFIDEAHTLIGAGGAAGQNDAANLLKPALARGELRCIAATTWQEYVKYFEKDPALARRFQNILVDEPDDEKAVEMLRGLVKTLEKHHRVEVLDEALGAAVKLSRRYLPTRQLPDKAVSVLDTACARVALSQSAEPAAIEFSRRRIEALELELSILEREAREGIDHASDIAETMKKLEAERSRKASLEAVFEKARTIAEESFRLRDSLAGLQAEAEKPDAAAEAQAAALERLEAAKHSLSEKREALRTLQGESPMVLTEVDEAAVSAVIAEWTGIPIGRMVKNEIAAVLHLSEEMQKRVVGQNHGLDLIARRIATARASLADPNKPIAVIMLAGPSGTGKTETALALAEQLYGTERNLVTINMSEFQEAHTVSTLKGAPPGYVGYGEGGVLTEAVRRKPYSVVLLDEVEKAHKDVHEIFFQVFDKGQMEDGAGRLVNFRNTVILLTTNVGDEEIMSLCTDEAHYPPVETLQEAIMPAMRRVFPAALIGRLTIVPYYPLSREVLHRIITLKLKKIVKRVAENYRAELIFAPAVKDEIIRRCNNAASGARLIDAVISNDLLPEVSAAFLRAAMSGETLRRVEVSAADGRFAFAFDNTEA